MATKTKPKADEVYICRESFASHEFSIARGARLPGDHPAVQRHPGYFIPAATATEAQMAPVRPMPEEPVREPIGRVKLRVLPVEGERMLEQLVWHGGRGYHANDTFEAEVADAQHLLDVGACEVVKKLRPRTAEQTPAPSTTGRSDD
jgi:hypothetical protein